MEAEVDKVPFKFFVYSSTSMRCEAAGLALSKTESKHNDSDVGLQGEARSPQELLTEDSTLKIA